MRQGDHNHQGHRQRQAVEVHHRRQREGIDQHCHSALSTQARGMDYTVHRCRQELQPMAECQAKVMADRFL